MSGLLSIVHGEAPMAGRQVPGYYRMMLGQFEITALADGSIDLDAHLINNAPETRIKGLLYLFLRLSQDEHIG